jgi:ribosome-binding protein aMBF1 (putative translation factor)
MNGISFKTANTKWDRVALNGPKAAKIDERPIPDHVLPVIRRLVETRRAWNLSIVDVAGRCGGDHATFIRYERGDKLPSTKTLMKWASVLGFQISLWPKK